MKDTSSHMDEKFRQMMRQKTPADRLAMGCSMFDFSKGLAMSSILNEKGKLSPAALRRELFLRFYSNDFNLVQQEKIVKHLVNITERRFNDAIKA